MSICVRWSKWNWKEQIKFNPAGIKVAKAAQALDTCPWAFMSFFKSNQSNSDHHLCIFLQIISPYVLLLKHVQ